MPTNRATGIATIDVALVVVTTEETTPRAFALDTSSKIGIESEIETQDAIKLIIKGNLKAQKGEQSTLTGTKITLTDNVFTPELVQVLQGGTILYWSDASHTSTSTTDAGYGIAKYTPALTGQRPTPTYFTMEAYSAIYNAAAQIVGYEKATYPHCYGDPVAFSAEDDVFRAPEYTIHSAPDTGEAPYVLDYVDELPVIIDTNYVAVTQNLTSATSSFTGYQTPKNQAFTATITADQGKTLGTVTVTMGGEDISTTAVDGGSISVASVTGALVITATAS